MPLSGVDRFFWIAGLVGHCLVMAVLVIKGRAAQFPVFTALIGNNILRTLLLFLVWQVSSPRGYVLAYLTELAIDDLLQLAVLYEVASHVFRPLGHWAPDARRGLAWLVAGSVLLTSVLVWLAAPGQEDWRLNLLGKTNFFTACLLSELFLGLLLLSVSTGLPWRTHTARIAYGLGLYSVVDILIEAGQTAVGRSYPDAVGLLLTHLRMATYLGCMTYWAATLWQAAPAPRVLPSTMQSRLLNLQTRVAYDLFTLRSWKKP